jgi:Flp pilus assembly protein TadG
MLSIMRDALVDMRSGARGGCARVARWLPGNERGTAAIEFAIVAAVFLTIVFGIIGFGFQFATRIALSYAVAEGGRAAVAGISDAERTTLATEAINRVIEAYSPLVQLDPSYGAGGIVAQANGTTDSGSEKFLIGLKAVPRFTYLPFVPDMSDLPAVEATFIVSNPAG